MKAKAAVRMAHRCFCLSKESLEASLTEGCTKNIHLIPLSAGDRALRDFPCGVLQT